MFERLHTVTELCITSNASFLQCRWQEGYSMYLGDEVMMHKSAYRIMLPKKAKVDAYSYGGVFIDTCSACECEIYLDCACYYPTAHTQVSAVTCGWAIEKQLYCSRTARTQPRIALLAQQKCTSLNMHLNSLKCQWKRSHMFLSCFIIVANRCSPI